MQPESEAQDEHRLSVEVVAHRGSKSSLPATYACFPNADQSIVFDKYHAFRPLTATMDQVRRQQNKALQPENDTRLTGTKHLWL